MLYQLKLWDHRYKLLDLQLANAGYVTYGWEQLKKKMGNLWIIPLILAKIFKRQRGVI